MIMSWRKFVVAHTLQGVIRCTSNCMYLHVSCAPLIVPSFSGLLYSVHVQLKCYSVQEQCVVTNVSSGLHRISRTHSM